MYVLNADISLKKTKSVTTMTPVVLTLCVLNVVGAALTKCLTRMTEETNNMKKAMELMGKASEKREREIPKNTLKDVYHKEVVFDIEEDFDIIPYVTYMRLRWEYMRN